MAKFEAQMAMAPMSDQAKYGTVLGNQAEDWTKILGHVAGIYTKVSKVSLQCDQKYAFNST